jgi:putative endonuclease
VPRDVWYVYVARCADDSLYCGIARDVAARIAEHDAGRGARYTRGRGPLAVLAVRRCHAKGTALRLEHAWKQLTRARKEAWLAASGERALSGFASSRPRAGTSTRRT